MKAIRNSRSKNTNTLLDWVDMYLSVENEDPSILDMKYFATYDQDFGLKLGVDGLHNLPKKQGLFYVVIVSFNPPASLYTESQVPTKDVSYLIIYLPHMVQVNLINTFDWDSSVLSIRYLDDYFYF